MIKDYKDKDEIDALMLLVGIKEGKTTNGSPYASLTLQDSSGTIEGKYWDIKPEKQEILSTGTIYHVKGIGNVYRGSMQMKILDISVNEQAVDISNFVVKSKVAKNELEQIIDETLASIQDPELKELLNYLFTNNRSDFFDYPAAMRNHHEFASGLATHVSGMCKLGKAICEIYPLLNRDLLLSGILVHDMGKLIELSGPIAPEYTTEGRLIGHISIMHAQIVCAAKELNLNSESILLLRHLVLSHHGNYEFGSPVLPMVPEAEALFLIDNMDARMEMFSKALADIKEGEFSQRMFALENRSVYKAKKD